MITKIGFVLVLSVASIMAHPFFGGCNCGLGSGEDICTHNNNNKKCTPLVVRPVEIPKPMLPAPKVACAPVGGIPPLPPIGSPCSCRTSLVKPAVVPKPACNCGCAGGIDITNNHQLTLSQKQQILFGGSGVAQPVYRARPIVVDDESEKSPVNPANYVPADPVSLHVAYKLAQESCNHNEDKLSFGFRSLPREVPVYVRRVGNSIPEENLYNLNGQIVELKKKKCSNTKSLDEEAKEQLTQLAEEEEEDNLDADVNNNVKHISLGEIGYGPANIQNPTFISIKSSPSLDNIASGMKTCNDGFQPGNVMITQVPKKEHISLPPLLPEPCPPEKDSFIPPPPAVPSGSLFTSPYTYLSSSSSAASSNLYKKSVFLQKVGCS